MSPTFFWFCVHSDTARELAYPKVRVTVRPEGSRVTNAGTPSSDARLHHLDAGGLVGDGLVALHRLATLHSEGAQGEAEGEAGDGEGRARGRRRTLSALGVLGALGGTVPRVTVRAVKGVGLDRLDRLDGVAVGGRGLVGRLRVVWQR